MSKVSRNGDTILLREMEQRWRWPAGIVRHKKSPGAIFNVACDGPKGGGQDARHKKSPGAIFNVACDGPKGGGQDARHKKSPFAP
ncbi:hypothetical protein ABRZ24_14345 [Brenneria populi]|uniref:DUF5641 domain-containing protein n=1 Tax=Brenneria populi TaxID=1505588 RepID=A0ABU6JST2_9GAMM|nr:hypothetical protein [Brenneria populi Li et al. 2015]